MLHTFAKRSVTHFVFLEKIVFPSFMGLEEMAIPPAKVDLFTLAYNIS